MDGALDRGVESVERLREQDGQPVDARALDERLSAASSLEVSRAVSNPEIIENSYRNRKVITFGSSPESYAIQDVPTALMSDQPQEPLWYLDKLPQGAADWLERCIQGGGMVVPKGDAVRVWDRGDGAQLQSQTEAEAIMQGIWKPEESLSLKAVDLAREIVNAVVVQGDGQHRWAKLDGMGTKVVMKIDANLAASMRAKLPMFVRQGSSIPGPV